MEISAESKQMDIGAAIRNIALMEEMINSRAKTVLAPRHGIIPNHFNIYLSKDLGDKISSITPGSPVEIYINWPQGLFTINSIINDALACIKRHKLYRPMEMIPFMLFKSYSDDIKKGWKKEQFDEKSDIVLDLIPRTRIQIEETVITRLTDMQTGESISISRNGKKTKFDGDAMALWMQLSRIVRDKHSISDIIENEKDEKNGTE